MRTRSREMSLRNLKEARGRLLVYSDGPASFLIPEKISAFLALQEMQRVSYERGTPDLWVSKDACKRRAERVKVIHCNAS